MKRPKRKPAQAIGPTPERKAKSDWDDAITERAWIFAKRVRLRDQVDLLHSQGKLTRDEFNACEHFHSTYRAAYGADCQIARYDKGISGGAGAGKAYNLAAIRQLSSAIGQSWHWLIAVIIEGERMRPLERRMSVRNGEGLGHFTAAIKAMTDFWGMPNEPAPKRESKVDTGTAINDNASS